MIRNENETRHEYILGVCQMMMTAARTAPKGKGIDNLEIITVTGDDLKRLADGMRDYHDRVGFKFFLRDAMNVEQAEAVVLIGSSLGVFNLNCGFCGFDTCTAKMEYPRVPCAFNPNDLGIALGSAVSIAADMRIDNRIMYSVARSAIDIGMLKHSDMAFGILLSGSGKNPFFDRVAHKPAPNDK